MRQGTLFRNERPVLHRVWRADRWWQRLRGLLLRPQLGAGDGLLITPCAGIHTIGMGYPLDVVFLDAQGHVLACRRHVRPWRARAEWGARETLELRAGAVADLGIVPGDRLRWSPASTGDAA